VFGKGLEPDITEGLYDDVNKEQKQSDSNRLPNLLNYY